MGPLQGKLWDKLVVLFVVLGVGGDGLQKNEARIMLRNKMIQNIYTLTVLAGPADLTFKVYL